MLTREELRLLLNAPMRRPNALAIRILLSTGVRGSELFTRSTMKSHMRAPGVPRDISEMCLNHKLTGVEGIYDQHTYYPERRQALSIWLQFLMDCQAGDGSAVEEPEWSRRAGLEGRATTPPEG